MDLEVLKLAFRFHALTELVTADYELHPAEAALLKNLEPAMMEAGLMDGLGRMQDVYTDAKRAALNRLPLELDLASRLALTAEILDAANVDGKVADTEEGIVDTVARALGITRREVDDYVAARDG